MGRMLTGACLCGAVSYQIDGRISVIWYCHCSKCRKTSGSAFRAGCVCKGERFRWVRGQESIAEYLSPSGYRTRFCRTCGSTVPSEPSGTDYVWLPVGGLNGDPQSRASHHIFVGSKAAWFEISDDLPQFEEHAPQTP